MSFKKIGTIFILLLIIGIVVQFISFDFILNYLKNDFSSDGIIEKSTYLNYKSKYQFLKFLMIGLPLLCLIFISFSKKIEGIVIWIHNNFKKFINYLFSRIKMSHLFWFSLL